MSNTMDSPGRLAWRRFRRNRTAMTAAAVLASFYLLAIFAGFFSPYSPTDQEFRSHFFHPPTQIHFRDSSGAFHLRPHVITTYLADRNVIRYAAGIRASICYNHPPANRNPYLRDDLEHSPAVITISSPSGRILSQLNSLQETAEDSGIFCAPLSLDPQLLAETSILHAATQSGETARFEVTEEAPEPDSAAASGLLFLRNDKGESVSSYSRKTERIPVEFLVRGWRYRILWFFESDLHLFGVANPGHIFLLGTDQSGRDQFSRILYGARVSLTVGLVAVGVTTLLGLLIGGIAGYYGGSIDALIMRFAEILLAIPALYLILALRNIIPDRVQESYDRIRHVGMETFAWQQSAPGIALVAITILLLLSYYCYRGKWSRGRLVISALLATAVLAGPVLLDLLLAAAQVVLPGSTHLTSQWTYFMIVVILSMVGWASMARVIRGMVLSLRESEYVLAARTLGATDARVMIRHILPNTLGYVLVRATLTIPAYILAEITLSFLGLGVQEPLPSWGNMLTQAQNLRVLTQFTWTLAPGFFIFATVLAYNILGDGLRDALDPQQR